MKKMKVAIFGGSFNPPTVAHLSVGNSVLKAGFAKVVFVPCGFREDKKNFASNAHRWNMMQLALKDSFGQSFTTSLTAENSFSLVLDDRELKGDRMVPTGLLMQQYMQEFPSMDFHFVIGADLLDDLSSWGYYESILSKLNFVVLGRDGVRPKPSQLLNKSIWIDSNLHVSSTRVRQILEIKEKSEEEKYELEKLVTPSTLSYIQEHQLYLLS